MQDVIGISMKTVVIRAPLLSYSGYGTHSRQIFKWLLTQNVNVITQVVPWGMTSWMINPEHENGLVGEIMDRSKPLKTKADLSIQVQLPNEWDPSLAKRNVGVSAFVETDQCNPKWILNCNQMDMIVVPSEHVKTCIQNTGSLNVPLHVVPESYYDNIPAKKELPLSLDTDFNFLLFGQLTGTNPYNDRKNIFNTIKWMCEEFKDDPNVGIVIKTNSGKNTKIDKVVTEKLLKSLLKEVRTGPYPKVHFLHGSLTQDEIASLYINKSIKALVSLTRGEGYGLPLLEAAVSGLPVIATNWSGHLDFLNKGKFVKVGYSLQEIHKSRVDGRIFLPGMKWAEPVEKDVKERLRKFYEASKIPEKWANDLSLRLQKEYSQESICEMYNEVFNGLI